MKTLIDADSALSAGLATIRAEFQIPAAFPPQVEAAAQAAIARPLGPRADRTGLPFVTLDPAASTDLDQAFAIERRGGDILLHYAIADVAHFVADGDALDAEGWARGETFYLPDGKAGLYPKALSENAASLLPDGPRPAIIFTTSVAPDGAVALQGVERALIRSRAKLAYETVRDEDLPESFADLAARIITAEQARGAARVDPPEQEVNREGGHIRLAYRPRRAAEDANAALSLATNLAVADALLAHKTGLFRVMAAPDAPAVMRLRHTAKALGLDWPATMELDEFSRRLRGVDPKQAAFMLAIRRAGTGASYAPYRAGETPWHAAVGATYAHATAPLRRLADRYVIRAALAVANGQAVPAEVEAGFARLPKVMGRADARAGQIERAVIDLAEAVLLSGREGQHFTANVIDAGVDDDKGRFAKVQLCDLPVVVRIERAGAVAGAAMILTLDSVDVAKRQVHFSHFAEPDWP